MSSSTIFTAKLKPRLRNYKMEFDELLPLIIKDNQLHARWLNTLSLLENTGARKISACEDPETVTYIILKHAAEEHRHAFYLKKQIEKIDAASCPTYSSAYLLASNSSRHYLNQLDVDACRYLKNELGLKGAQLRFAAYLLVTYAIEVRADELYPVYQDALDKVSSKINVKSIILEEEGHLEEMIKQLQNFSPDWQYHAGKAVEMESRLFKLWTRQLGAEIENKKAS